MRALMVSILCALSINLAVADDAVNAAPEDMQAEVTNDIRVAPTTDSQDKVDASSLPDIQVSAHPKVLESVGGNQAMLLKYRLSENLPEVTNEELLQGFAEKEAVARLKAGTVKVGTLPRLKLLPCDVGCDTDEYRKAAQQFLAKYHKAVANGHFTYRGSMTVKVRWFQVKSFWTRKLSLHPDVFAISFPIEGKLLTFSTRQRGSEYDLDSLTTKAAARFFIMMFNQVGIGVKPTPLQRLIPGVEVNALTKFSDATAGASQAMDRLVGQEDVRSRLEPMTEADNDLLPAFDGILPNEVDPITEAVIFNDI